ncbi:MAG: hypothetical protein KDA20_12445, partial [Phycisphaerales bacterium]|nr:hypothetical protein [Phycisphaerales bacterium]
MLQSVRTLLTGLIDYAGLFPPTACDMATAVQTYARDLASPHAWMLSRLIVPVARLGEFETASEALLPRAGADGPPEPWRVSALIGQDLKRDIDTLFEFNLKHEAKPELGAVVVDAIELRCSNAQAVDSIMREVPEQLEPFLEVDHRDDVRGVVAAMAGTGARAKIRCGGVTPDLIPSAAQIASFIHACAAADVAFKATAGLHHPVRSEHPLTYEQNAPRGTMHGFLNVFGAAALASACRLDADELERVILETDPRAFIFTETGLSWRDAHVDAGRLARVRESFAVSVGSCS